MTGPDLTSIERAAADPPLDLRKILDYAGYGDVWPEVARQAGWVRLSDVLDALRDEAIGDWKQYAIRFLDGRFSAVPEQETKP